MEKTLLVFRYLRSGQVPGLWMVLLAIMSEATELRASHQSQRFVGGWWKVAFPCLKALTSESAVS